MHDTVWTYVDGWVTCAGCGCGRWMYVRVVIYSCIGATGLSKPPPSTTALGTIVPQHTVVVQNDTSTHERPLGDGIYTSTKIHLRKNSFPPEGFFEKQENSHVVQNHQFHIRIVPVCKESKLNAYSTCCFAFTCDELRVRYT